MANKTYEMPLVVKDVYLPLHFLAADEMSTLEVYKENTGIDLNDVFIFDFKTGLVRVKPLINLHFVVAESIDEQFSAELPLSVVTVTDFRNSIDGSETTSYFQGGRFNGDYYYDLRFVINTETNEIHWYDIVV